MSLEKESRSDDGHTQKNVEQIETGKMIPDEYRRRRIDSYEEKRRRYDRG